MVVEDEPPILRSICKKIECVSDDFKVVCTACNGREAIEKLNGTPLDLVFVDINIPVLNGIKVLEHINSSHIDVMTVILSGYKDFEYVKAAFERKTIDYLLKPLSEEELGKFLRKVEHEYNQKCLKRSGQILNNALKGKPSEHPLSQNAEYQMMIFIAGTYQYNTDKAVDNMETVWADVKLEDTMKKLFGTDLFWVFDGQADNEKIAFVGNNLLSEFTKAKNIFDSLQTGALPITLAINKSFVKATEIYHIYRDMKKFVRDNMIFCKASMLFYHGQVVSGDKAKGELIDDSIKNCKADGSPDTIYKEISGLIGKFERTPTKQNEVQQLIKRFFYGLCASLPSNKQYVEIEGDIDFILSNYQEVKKIDDEFKFLVNECFGTAANNFSEKQKLAQSVKAFLDSNYTYNITSKMLSTKFGFVPSYISSIFRKEFGFAISDYVMELRIEEAKNLLENSSLLIKDISEKVGYNDPLYFSKVFKRVEGLNPTEFLNHNKENENKRGS